ncbi:hypothetical protein [Streptomyces sp. NBC_00236]|uniref:hypothetical protein n=1 Tax=unclassified Streptomyces TaxID=2593676 RepID=UPI002E2BD9FF|nr:hypothetical protein [Streptomyces sp. NBC_00236]
MNGIQLALHTLHDGEQHLATQLVTVADRHRTDHEIHHVATDIAAWSHEHVRRLAEALPRYGLSPGGASGGRRDGGPCAALPRSTGDMAGHRSEPGLSLLCDLRDLHLAAAYNSLHWEMLAQVAQAAKAADLLSLATSCHPRTLRQLRWTNTMVKTLSPQVLSSL